MAAALISIKSDDDKLEIVNQLLLPHTTEYIEINSVEDAHDAIKTMKVGSRHFSTDALILMIIERSAARLPLRRLLPCQCPSTLLADCGRRHFQTIWTGQQH